MLSSLVSTSIRQSGLSVSIRAFKSSFFPFRLFMLASMILKLLFVVFVVIWIFSQFASSLLTLSRLGSDSGVNDKDSLLPEEGWLLLSNRMLLLLDEVLL